MKIKVINRSSNPLPQYETDQAAGMDLRASLEAAVSIPPLGRTLVPTGLHLEIPTGYEGQVRPRSGLAFKSGVTVLNSPGTIDADYRGEVKVLLVNLSDSAHVISPGDRIAQLVIAAHATAEVEQVEVLDESTRGQGGFGSTGDR